MYLVSSSLILSLFFCLEFPMQGVASPPPIFLVTKTIFPFSTVPSGAMFKATVKNNVDDIAS